MKAEVIKTEKEKVFEPIMLKIVIESEAELKELHRLLGEGSVTYTLFDKIDDIINNKYER